MANQTSSSATNLNANTFTRTGYTFNGWNTAANGSGTAYADQASFPFTADATLYAQWTLITSPTITLSENTLSGMDYNQGSGPSANQSFSASGSSLTANITITAPTNFHVSTNATSGFGPSLTLTQSGGTVNATTIYVRLIAGLSENTYSGTLNATSTGATTQSISLTGEVTNQCASENFSNLPTSSSSSYASRSWTGTDNVTWTAVGARTDQTINGKAICFGTTATGNRWVTSPTYNNGLGTLKFKYVRGFQGTGGRSIQVWVNGVQQGGNITVSNTSNVVQEYEQTLNIGGSVVVEIRSVGASQVKIDDLEWSCYEAPCFTPDNHASAVSSASVTTNSATLNWTNGNGTERIVVMRAVSDVNANPANTTSYVANNNFGDGDEIGTGNFVVYRGSGSSVSVTGLTPGTVYYAKIFEFACNPGSEEYFTSGTPGNTNFFTTPLAPTNFSALCIGSNEIDLSWSAPVGDFDGYMLVARTTSNELSVNAIDPTSQTHNLDYSVAPTYSAASPPGRILYIGSNNSATVTGLANATAYTFRVYTFKSVGSVNKFSTSSATTQTIDLNNVTNQAGAALNEGAFITWNNPSSSCFDEVLVVANTTAGIDFAPSGDGSAYTANAAYNGNNSVVYKGVDPSSVDVTNLVNGDTYYFEIFVRKGTSWSSGLEVSVVPADVTILNSGDVAIIAMNTQYLGSGSDDEICFVAFKDIKPGTSLEFTDNGYERVNAGQWGNTEGTIRLTYNGASDIVAGTPICIQGAGFQTSDFDVLVCGVNTPANWTVSSLNGNFAANFDLNVTDQIWMMQNGSWNPGQKSPALHNATYSGNILWGWTAVGWESAPNYASTSGSTLVEGMDCFNNDMNGKTNPDKIKYTGPLTAANQSEWILRINDANNWTGYSSNSNYNSASGRDYSGSCVSFPVNSGGFQEGVWSGVKGNDWFNCGNWDDLKLPSSTVDVTVPNTTNEPVIGDGLATCRNITIENSSNLTMDNVNSELHVYGNWTNNSGGNLDLRDDNNATVRFRGAGTKTISGSEETRFQRLFIEDGALVNLNADARVGGTGLLRIDGAVLGATHNPGDRRTLTIQGTSTLEIINGGSMHENALDHLDIVTGGNSSTATFSSNGEAINCWNFESSKSTSGGVILNANSLLVCKNDFDLNMAGTAVFTDNGNTITIGDDLKLDGDGSANFNFTGTVVFNGAGSGATSTIQNGSDAVVGHLNNLVIIAPVSRPDVQINPQTGNQTTTIKGDLTIESGVLVAHGNTIALAGNWVNNAGQASFSESTSTVLFNGSSMQNIDASSGEVFYNMTLDKSAAGILNMNDDVEVSNVLNFTNGIITTNSNTLTLSDDATSAIVGANTSGSDKFINGRLIRNTNNGSYSFPIGTIAHGAQGFSIDVTGSGNVLGFLENNNTAPLYNFAYCDIETTNAPNSQIGQGSPGADGFLDQMTFDLSSALQWNVTNPGGGISQYDITLDANGSNNVSPVLAADGTPIRFTMKNGEPGNTGVAVGNIPTDFDDDGFLACPNGYSLIGMTSFSTFTINGSSGSNTALPVELLFFNATLNGKVVDLTWSTASELNNDYFTVERSVDGFNWENVVQVSGAGTTNQTTNYSDADTRPYNGLSYYRLKQNDLDGEFSYSDIVSVVVDTEEKQLIKVLNILGQEVDLNTKGMVIFIFSDGESLKRINE